MSVVPLAEKSSQEWTETLFSGDPERRFPWACQWELTCRCNLKCVMCYTDCFNTPEQIRQELTTKEIFHILAELQEAGCVELTFTGGDPMARSDFMEIYEEAYRLGFLITLFTNGTYFTPEKVDHLASFRPKCVEISLHGVSEKVFEGVTQIPGSFKRCLQGIRLLTERQIPVVLKTVGLPLNKKEVLAIKHYAESLGSGVQWKFGQYLRNDLEKSGAPFRFQLAEEELRELERQDPKLWEAKCEELEQFESVKPICGGGKRKLHIDAYGRPQLCSNNRRASYDLRRGTLEHGFYEVLPTFPCPRRSNLTNLNPCSCKSGGE